MPDNQFLNQDRRSQGNPRPVAFYVVVGLVAFLSGGWLLRHTAAGSAGVYEKARLLDSVITLVSDYYVDSLNAGQLYDLATEGMLASLGDPYTEFLDPDELVDHQTSMRGNYVGIGVRIEISDGWLTIVAPLADTPAEEAGIEAGDLIVEVAGESTRGWSADNAVLAMRGDSGATVELGVVRPGVPEVMRFSLIRTLINVTPVRHTQLLDEDIGYVQLETVSARSARQVADAVTRLRDAGARSLILDLRFNPGGLLDEGIGVSDLFLEAGDVVVETRGRLGVTSRTYKARTPEEWSGMPVVVLVNEFSASASELIAGALQDHDRALVLGTTTFGKGLVQSIFQINRSEALRLTTSRWYTPSGRSIHREQRNSRRLRETQQDSTESVPRDSAFRSTGGRILTGGGGIRPDVVVDESVPSPAEQRFQRALGSKLQQFRDAVGSYALEIKAGGTVQDPADVVVTPNMRRELFTRLRQRDVAMRTDVWDAARNFVDQQLRRRVLRYVFGREAEMQDQIANDAVVGKAVDLLKRAHTQEELFALARREDAPAGR